MRAQVVHYVLSRVSQSASSVRIFPCASRELSIELLEIELLALESLDYAAVIIRSLFPENL